MTRLSYSGMNALINEPHTWLCKQMGLKTFTTKYFEEGKEAHRIIQEHVSGVKLHPLLKDLPIFPVVEKVDFDEDTKIYYKIDDKYELIGFCDGLNPEKGEILEIKSGKTWSPTDFKKLMQWKLYCLALPETKKIWLVNVPRDPNLWMPQTIKILNTTVTPQDVKEAEEFIKKAVDIIENIKAVLEQNPGTPGVRSKWCFYDGCPWCEGEK